MLLKPVEGTSAFWLVKAEWLMWVTHPASQNLEAPVHLVALGLSDLIVGGCRAHRGGGDFGEHVAVTLTPQRGKPRPQAPSPGKNEARRQQS